MARNQKLADIRYFECLSLPSPDESSPNYAGDEIYSGFDAETTAFGARIASKCRELGISVGRQNHLFILFTPAVRSGNIVPLSYQTEVWNRFVAFGLPLSFNRKSTNERRRAVESSTFKVLRTVARKGARFVDTVAMLHKQYGRGMRIVLKEKEYGSTHLRVTQTLMPYKQPSTLWLEAIDKPSGRRGECVVTPLKRYDDGRLLAQKILLQDRVVSIHPYTSSDAQYYTKAYPVPFRVTVDQVLSPTSRSTRSRVKRAPG